MRRLETAAGTDRGRTRKRNEDAYFAGDCIFAVADGMGGHLAGDVASATALLPIEGLDGRVFPDAPTAQAALLDAILAANAAVVRKAANEPTLHGMGTTLTATIVEGKRLHVGHVGDSRAYLVRGDQLIQLTRDHTLVAHLIEEGQITKEEAAIHPQRSIITRAIGVDVDLEVDTLTIELQDGDQVMLCSDGLTGPVADEDILATLRADRPLEESVQRLIDLANEHGGPDNITVVLLRYGEDEEGAGPGEAAGAAGAAAAGAAAGAAAAGEDPPTTRIRTREESDGGEGSWARALGRYGADRAGTPDPDDTAAAGGTNRTVTVILVTLTVIAAAVLGGWWLLSRSYWVGAEDGQVVIFHGAPNASIGPVDLYWPAERTDVALADLPPFLRTQFEEGRAATDLEDARRIVDNARQSAATTEPGGSSPPASPAPTPTAAATT